MCKELKAWKRVQFFPYGQISWYWTAEAGRYRFKTYRSSKFASEVQCVVYACIFSFPKFVVAITVCEISLTRLKQLSVRSVMIRKTHGVSKCLSPITLYCTPGMYQLHLISLVEEYKVSKIQLKSVLSETMDTVIRNNPSGLNTGKLRMWCSSFMRYRIMSMLKYVE